MKYLNKPTQLRTTIQVYKKGFKYRVVVNRFDSEGTRESKLIKETPFAFRVKSYIINELDEDAFNGIHWKEVEITNYTTIPLYFGVIKIHNCR